MSKDSVSSHQKFKKKYGIPFRLLADVDAKLCNAFGAISDKNMYGKIIKGVTRSTFLIDASGKILKVWPKVAVEGHAEDVLAALP